MTRIVVVGSIVTDLAFRIDHRPGPGEVALATDFGRYRGGKGYNQAVAAARLGAEVVMVGAVSDDDFGRDSLAALAREGVDATRVRVVPDVATAVAVPMITPDGDVAFVHHRGANQTLGAEVAEDLPTADVLLLQGEVPAAANIAAAWAMAGLGAAIMLNPAPVTDVPPELTGLVDLITPNEVEAAALLAREGTAVSGPVDGVAAATALVAERRHAVVTLGSRGAAWADGTSAGLVAPPMIEMVDATAAGDSFCAALAVARCEGADYPQALRFATAAGAHAATIAGAEPSLPTRADVERLLARA